MNTTSAECVLDENLTIIAFQKQKSLADWAFHHHLTDSDVEVVTEQLTAVVDVTFIPHSNLEIS